MDLFKDEITPDLNKIDTKISNNEELSFDDLKIILLGVLAEEDHCESKQS
jgi:hypothetical protein